MSCAGFSVCAVIPTSERVSEFCDLVMERVLFARSNEEVVTKSAGSASASTDCHAIVLGHSRGSFAVLVFVCWLALNCSGETDPSVGDERISDVLKGLGDAQRKLVVSDVGPRGAVKRLRATVNNEDMSSWCERARVDALLGSCPKSIESVKSGIRAWLEFVEIVLSGQRDAFPPSLGGLLAWSKTFRSSDTFSNYISYVKLACELVGASTTVFSADELRRARMSIRKQGGFTSRKKMFLRMGVLERLTKKCVEGRAAVEFGMLYLVSYVFLLRLPSEALPIVWAGSEFPFVKSEKAAIILANGRLGLQLAWRKNKQTSSTFWRSCWCSTSASTCPVHVLGNWLSQLPLGTRPFSGITASMALKRLRALLAVLRVAEAFLYRTHDFRRGHADDMRRSGATLAEILLAGGWNSAAFQDYLDMHAVEEDAVFEAHVCASSDSD